MNKIEPGLTSAQIHEQLTARGYSPETAPTSSESPNLSSDELDSLMKSRGYTSQSEGSTVPINEGFQALNDPKYLDQHYGKDGKPNQRTLDSALKSYGNWSVRAAAAAGRETLDIGSGLMNALPKGLHLNETVDGKGTVSRLLQDLKKPIDDFENKYAQGEQGSFGAEFVGKTIPYMASGLVGSSGVAQGAVAGLMGALTNVKSSDSGLSLAAGLSEGAITGAVVGKALNEVTGLASKVIGKSINAAKSVLKGEQDLAGASKEILDMIGKRDPEVLNKAIKTSQDIIDTAKNSTSAQVNDLYSTAYKTPMGDKMGIINNNSDTKFLYEKTVKELDSIDPKTETDPEKALLGKRWQETPDGSVGRTDMVKRIWDDFINSSKGTNVNGSMTDAGRQYNNARVILKGAADSAAPEYAQARALVGETAEGVKSLSSSAIGKMAIKDPSQLINIGTEFFSKKTPDPVFNEMRDKWIATDPEGYKSMLRHTIENKADAATAAAERTPADVGNIIFGNQDTINMIQRATDNPAMADVRDRIQILQGIRSTLKQGEETSKIPQWVQKYLKSKGIDVGASNFDKEFNTQAMNFVFTPSPKVAAEAAQFSKDPVNQKPSDSLDQGLKWLQGKATGAIKDTAKVIGPPASSFASAMAGKFGSTYLKPNDNRNQ